MLAIAFFSCIALCWKALKPLIHDKQWTGIKQAHKGKAYFTVLHSCRIQKWLPALCAKLQLKLYGRILASRKTISCSSVKLQVIQTEEKFVPQNLWGGVKNVASFNDRQRLTLNLSLFWIVISRPPGAVFKKFWCDLPVSVSWYHYNWLTEESAWGNMWGGIRNIAFLNARQRLTPSL